MNKLLAFILKVLLQRYTKEQQERPRVLDTNVGGVLNMPLKEGGMESWIPGHSYPFPGAPDEKIVNMTATIKRMFPVALKYAWTAMRESFPHPSKYSKPVREVYRVLSLIRTREGEPQERGQWTEIRDVLCMILEFDDTYRFRFMEAIKELKKEELEFTDADKHWAEQKWKFDWSWQKPSNKIKVESYNPKNYGL